MDVRGMHSVVVGARVLRLLGDCVVSGMLSMQESVVIYADVVECPTMPPMPSRQWLPQ